MNRQLLSFIFFTFVSSSIFCAQKPASKVALKKKLRQECFRSNNKPSPAVIAHLLERGVDLSTNIYRHTKLLQMVAYTDQNAEVVKAVLRHRPYADKNWVDARGKNRFTALHNAAKCGAHQNALLLLEAGANVNALTSFDDTPLSLVFWFAVKAKPERYSSYITTAQILIDHGAIRHMRIGTGTIPNLLQFAESNKLPEFTHLIRKLIANPMHAMVKMVRADKQNKNYLIFLPHELVQELALFISNDQHDEQKNKKT